MAEQIGFNDTYYRLIESGRARIYTDLASAFICIFSPISRINFASISSLLVAESTLQRCLIQGYELEEAFVSLSEYPDLAEFINKTKPYLSLEDGSEPQKVFLENEVYDAVCCYLEKSPGQREHEQPYIPLIGFSPECIKIVENLARSLAGNRFVGEDVVE
jgi:hypothetical protein